MMLPIEHLHKTTVELQRGYVDADGVVHRTVEIRELTKVDLDAAHVKTREVVRDPATGQMLFIGDDTRYNNELLRLRVVRVGDIAGPLSEPLWARMRMTDLSQLDREANAMDYALLNGVMPGKQNESDATSGDSSKTPGTSSDLSTTSLQPRT